MGLSQEKRENGETVAKWQQEAASKGARQDEDCEKEYFFK